MSIVLPTVPPSPPSRTILQPLAQSSSPVSLNKFSTLTPPLAKRKLNITENVTADTDKENVVPQTNSITKVRFHTGSVSKSSSASATNSIKAASVNSAKSTNSTNTSVKSNASKPPLARPASAVLSAKAQSVKVHTALVKPINVRNQTPAHKKSMTPFNKLALSTAVNPVTFGQPIPHPISTPAIPLVTPSQSPFINPLLPSSSPFNTISPSSAPHWAIDYRQVHRIRCPPLGTGAYGTVYRAEWHGVQVAVKQLDTDYLDPSAMKEFHQEMSVWSTLQFPSIVQLYGAFM